MPAFEKTQELVVGLPGDSVQQKSLLTGDLLREYRGCHEMSAKAVEGQGTRAESAAESIQSSIKPRQNRVKSILNVDRLQ